MPRWITNTKRKSSLYMRDWTRNQNEEWKKKRNKYTRDWRKKNREKARICAKKSYNKIRLEILTYYSSKKYPVCKCCGERGIDFLCIDHTKGNGAAHRREIGMAQGVGIQKHKVNIGGNGLGYWLKKNGFPRGFQVLCYNCNMGKKANKYCPHEN